MTIEELAVLRSDWIAKSDAYHDHKPLGHDASDTLKILWDLEEKRKLSATSAARTAYDRGLQIYEDEKYARDMIADREADNIANGQDVDEPEDDGEVEF